MTDEREVRRTRLEHASIPFVKLQINNDGNNDIYIIIYIYNRKKNYCIFRSFLSLILCFLNDCAIMILLF